jgi:restriction system protein
MTRNEVPTFDELMDPTLQALKRLGGSASIDELVPEIVRLLQLPQDVADVPHGTTGRSELEYRSAWARTYLRNAGYIENSERAVWALTDLGSQTGFVDGRRLAREVSKQFQQERASAEELGESAVVNEPEAALAWEDKLLAVLQAMDPTAFERLCQRILRESRVHRGGAYEDIRRRRYRRIRHDSPWWPD